MGDALLHHPVAVDAGIRHQPKLTGLYGSVGEP